MQSIFTFIEGAPLVKFESRFDRLICHKLIIKLYKNDIFSFFHFFLRFFFGCVTRVGERGKTLIFLIDKRWTPKVQTFVRENQFKWTEKQGMKIVFSTAISGFWVCFHVRSVLAIINALSLFGYGYGRTLPLCACF